MNRREFWIQGWVHDLEEGEIEANVYDHKPTNWPKKPTGLHVHVREVLPNEVTITRAELVKLMNEVAEYCGKPDYVFAYIQDKADELFGDDYDQSR